MDNTYGFYSSGFFIAYMVFALLFGLICIIAFWRIFQKAGKPGWAAIIPIYNIIILLEIVGKPIWWLLLMLIPLVNIIVGIYVVNLLSKSFGKTEAFTLGLIFLGFIFYPILGFGSAKYNGPAGTNNNINAGLGVQ